MLINDNKEYMIYYYTFNQQNYLNIYNHFFL
jgi:hypothetical protein